MIHYLTLYRNSFYSIFTIKKIWKRNQYKFSLWKRLFCLTLCWCVELMWCSYKFENQAYHCNKGAFFHSYFTYFQKENLYKKIPTPRCNHSNSAAERNKPTRWFDAPTLGPSVFFYSPSGYSSFQHERSDNKWSAWSQLSLTFLQFINLWDIWVPSRYSMSTGWDSFWKCFSCI